MAAYAALISLKHTISRHFPNSVKEEISIMAEEIESTVKVLQILDNSKKSHLSRVEKVKTWSLAESQLLKLFPCDYPIVQFGFNYVDPLRHLLTSTTVDDASVIGGILRDELVWSRLLEHVLQSLSQQIKQQPQILADMDRAKQQINSFIQTLVEKIKKDDGHKSKNMVRLTDEFPKSTRRLLTGISFHAAKAFDEMETTVGRWNVRRSNRSRERVNALEVQIREAACGFEDLLETRLSDLFPVARLHTEDINEVKQCIPPFTQLLGRLKQEYINELIDPLPGESGDNDGIVSSRKPYKTKMVGLYDEVDKIKEMILFQMTSHLNTFSIIGMGGIGKTTVAEQVFEDPSVLESFELRAWVDVGQKYQLKRIKQSILAQVLVSSPDINIDEILAGTDERLDEYLHGSLKGRRYLIVLDDVWEDDFWDDVIKKLIPDDGNGSLVLITTRRTTLTSRRWKWKWIRLLSEEESWELLCEKVFGEKSLCPPLLKNAAKKIANSCEGLPLTIVTVGELLSKVEKTPEKWNELADNLNSLLEDVYDQISKVLLPSYNYLPQHLKASFLFMGVFPRNYEITRSELVKLWVADKFLGFDCNRWGVSDIVERLVDDGLLMKRKLSTCFFIKSWKLHSSFWHLCKREATKNKFSYVVECRGDSLSEGIQTQRRLCVHKNVLLGIKDVHKSISSVSTARSLLCTGPPHQYPVPICYNLKLLRILNVLTIRLYEFPMDVLKLFHLRYLALTCYESLPSSISKLWNLEILIVRRHISICSSRAPSYLPVEIWDMKKLKHLEVMGNDLPDPCEGTFLRNLENLLDVSPLSCTKCVFQGTPNLKKLGIRIESMPDGHATETLRCFDHIYHLEDLRSLKCVVVNPTFGPHIVPPPLPLFPSSLQKLSLSGLGYPWEDMSLIASLPYLQSLKLRCYAFRGPKLDIKNKGFPKLGFLLIEDTDLVNLTVEFGSLWMTKRICLEDCYKLEHLIFVDHEHVSRWITAVNCFMLKNVHKP